MIRCSLALAAMLATLGACQDGEQVDNAPEATASREAATMPAQAGAPAPASPALNSTEPPADDCGADQLSQYLNVLPTDDIKAEIAAAVGHDRIRYIAPGDVVTQDLRADRLNVETGEDGRISLMRCG